jgi:hypothetical protein
MTQSLARALAQALRPAKQLRFAAEQALNDTLFAARKAVQVAMPQVFDRPTPFVISGVKVTTPRTIRETSQTTEAAGLGPGRFGAGAPLVGIISIDDLGRGKGASPENVLQAEIFGGARGFKGAERRLQAAGLMLPGQYMVPSRELLQQGNLVDAYGNVRGSFIRSLLSYLSAFTEGQGFRANMNQRSRDRIAARGRNASGFATINGVQYFVSKGPGERNGRQQSLPAGIWAKRGTGGARIYPVFLFVGTPIYRPRLSFPRIVLDYVNQNFPRRYAERADRAFATAR